MTPMFNSRAWVASKEPAFHVQSSGDAVHPRQICTGMIPHGSLRRVHSLIRKMPAAKISPTSANLSSAVMVLESGRPGAHLTLGGAAG